MADITVTYNGQNILEMSETGTKTLKTAKKRCKTDIEVAYVKSGGGSGIYTGTEAPPPASLGSDGDYYYQRGIWLRSIQSVNASIQSSHTAAYGTEFTVTQPVTVTHLFARTTASKTGKLQIGTTALMLAETATVSFKAGEWVEVPLESPIQLSTGTNYVVKVLVNGEPGYVAYVNRISELTYDSKFSYVRSRYGTSWPGTSEERIGVLVGVTYLASEGVYTIRKQFYKSSGSWSEIT